MRQEVISLASGPNFGDHYIYYVNYEAVRDNPEGFIEEIHRLYNPSRKGSFKPVLQYKGDQIQGLYKPKQYPVISTQDLEYINSQLDETLEESIGYEILR